MIPSQLRWACRRGMLELDILLGRFLENRYPHLSLEEKRLFEKLLHCEDQDLFEWFTDKKKPTDPELLLIVEKIKNKA